MGDIYPYGGPAYVTWQAAYNWFANEGYSSSIAATFAAIGSAESSLNYRVINDTPSTGDYSVGIWQINYYAGLYASRSAEFGTPQLLVEGGLSRQAFAALTLWKASGFQPWSTYNNGAYRNYLHGFTPPSGGSSGGQPTLAQGASGPSVTKLQNDLDQLGYNLSQDGLFGPATRAAVVAFQRAHGLSQDGVVGPVTWGAINAALPAQSPLGGPAVPVVIAPEGPPPAPTEGNINGSVTQAWSDLGYYSTKATGQQFATLGQYVNILRESIR